MNADQTVAIVIGSIFFISGICAFCVAWRKTDEESEERVQSFLDRV